MRIPFLLFLFVSIAQLVPGQLQIISANSRRLKFSIENESTHDSLCFNPRAYFVWNDGILFSKRKVVRPDRLKVSSDTLFVYLNDQPPIDEITDYSQDDSLNKKIGIFGYINIKALTKEKYNVHFYDKQSFETIDIIYNYGESRQKRHCLSQY